MNTDPFTFEDPSMCLKWYETKNGLGPIAVTRSISDLNPTVPGNDGEQIDHLSKVLRLQRINLKGTQTLLAIQDGRIFGYLCTSLRRNMWDTYGEIFDVNVPISYSLEVRRQMILQAEKRLMMRRDGKPRDTLKLIRIDDSDSVQFPNRQDLYKDLLYVERGTRSGLYEKQVTVV